MPDTCPKCSAALDMDAIFCPSCAAPVNPQCPKCGKSVSADAKFCKYCAFDLNQKVSTVNAQTSAIKPSEQFLITKPPFNPDSASPLEKTYHAKSDTEL